MQTQLQGPGTVIHYTAGFLLEVDVTFPSPYTNHL